MTAYLTSAQLKDAAKILDTLNALTRNDTIFLDSIRAHSISGLTDQAVVFGGGEGTEYDQFVLAVEDPTLQDQLDGAYSAGFDDGSYE